MVQKRGSLAGLAVLVALSSLLGSCANQSDADKTRTEALGAGAGAGLLLGKLAGQPNKVVMITTLIGAGVGAVAGENVVKDKERYARIEDQLNAVIAAAGKATDEARQANQKLASDILVLKRRKDDLLAQNQSAALRKSALAKEHAKALDLIGKTTKSIAVVDKQLIDQRHRLAEQKQALAEQKIDSDDLMTVAEKKVSGLETERSVLAASLEQLRMIDQRRAY